ncbi:ribonuclease, Rne/Rng family domain protein [Mycobacterium intracellulare]|nr:ribonuclease, Rne/Rng family domain protein [Mycobacterium intracellulare]
MLGGSSGEGPSSLSSPDPDLRRRRRRRRRLPPSAEPSSPPSESSPSSESSSSASSESPESDWAPFLPRPCGSSSSSPSFWPSGPPCSPRPRPRPGGRDGAAGSTGGRPARRRRRRNRRSRRSRRCRCRCRCHRRCPVAAARRRAACNAAARRRCRGFPASAGIRVRRHPRRVRWRRPGFLGLGGQQVTHPHRVGAVHGGVCAANPPVQLAERVQDPFAGGSQRPGQRMDPQPVGQLPGPGRFF